MKKLEYSIGWRRLLLVVGAAALLGVIVSAKSVDEQQFSAWSAAANLGPIVNSTYYDACPTISKSGLSLYFRSNRPGGQGGFDIWVSQRDSLEDPWKPPINLGPTINGPYGEYCTTFSGDGHSMVFVSNRPGGCGQQDLWISHRENISDDFGWETPKNLGCTVNSASAEDGPFLFEDEATGQTLLYFSSFRPGGLGYSDIYVSTAVSDEKDTFGPPLLVAELSSSAYDNHPIFRKDGLEVIFASNRPGGFGSYLDLWSSTRHGTLAPWFLPQNLGPLVNSTANDFRPTLSFDGTTLIFASERPGGQGSADLYICTRIDETPPVIDAHGNISVPATSPSGAVVTYTSPETHDWVDGTHTATCAPASGSTFPIGATTVNCNATDAAGNAAVTTYFTVTVTTSPLFTSGNSCNGVYTGTFNGNVTVSNGQMCQFAGGGINGNVTVHPDGKLNFSHSFITGNVEMQTGGDLVFNNAAVGGNVHLNGGGTFSFNGGTILGNLQIHNIPSGAAMNNITGVHVDGNLQFHNNGTAVVIGTGNTIGGNLQIQNNTAPVAPAVKVLSNSVGGNLQCSGNSSITGSGNTAAAKKGQCSLF